MQLFYIFFSGDGEAYQFDVSFTLLLIGLIIGALIVIGLYLFRSIGLYTLAKRAGEKHPFLAFIPAVWIYTACKLAKDGRLFGKTLGNLALVICIIFSCIEYLTFIFEIIRYFPLIAYTLQAGDEAVIYMTQSGYEENLLLVSSDLTVYPYASGFALYGYSFYYPDWFVMTLNVIGIVLNIAELVSIFISITVYFALFRRYWPEHYVLASILSIFLPLFGIFVFAIRKKEPVNFVEYMRSRYARFNGRYANPNNNQYNGQNANDNPFSDFDKTKDKKDDDPFSDFPDRK